MIYTYSNIYTRSKIFKKVILKIIHESQIILKISSKMKISHSKKYPMYAFVRAYNLLIQCSKLVFCWYSYTLSPLLYNAHNVG